MRGDGDGCWELGMNDAATGSKKGGKGESGQER